MIVMTEGMTGGMFGIKRKILADIAEAFAAKHIVYISNYSKGRSRGEVKSTEKPREMTQLGVKEIACYDSTALQETVDKIAAYFWINMQV